MSRLERQNSQQVPVPPELRGQPSDVLEVSAAQPRPSNSRSKAFQPARQGDLQEYVQARLRQHILARAGEMGAMGVAPPLLQAFLGGQAVPGAQGPQMPPGGGAPPALPARPLPAPTAYEAQDSTGGGGGGRGAPSQALVFYHECQRLGCADAGCQLCCNSPQRKCGPDFFSQKYFQGAVLTAACNAPLCVAVCSPSDGSVVQGGLPPGAQLECFLLNNRLYEQETADPAADKLLVAQLLKNAKGSNLLLCGPGAEQLPSGVVRMALSSPTATLPELRVDGSSEGLLGSKLWGYRLVVRVVDAAGSPMQGIQPALTPQFIVTTTRVKGNVKPAVPLTTDPVGKLNGIGDKMVEKLANGNELLAGVDVYVPPEGIVTVGDYRSLVIELDSKPKAQDKFIAALGLQKGWQESRAHALTSVAPDYYVRAWFADPHLSSGLLFRANLGTPVLDRPAAVVSSTPVGGLSASSVSEGAPSASVQLWHQQARSCWMLPGHPGWGLMAVECSDLDRALAEGRGSASLPPELVMPCKHDVAARLTAMPPPEQLVPGPAAPLPGIPSARAVMAPAGVPARGPAPAVTATTGGGTAGGTAGQLAGPPAGPSDGGMGEAHSLGKEQEHLPSPYETAMRLPSLPLLGREPFESLPKEVQAMESLSQMLFSDASLLPMLGQLAEQKAAAGEGMGGSGPGTGQAEELPSLLLQLLMSLEQHHSGQGGVTAGFFAGGGDHSRHSTRSGATGGVQQAPATSPAQTAAEADAGGSPFDPGSLPEQPSWIPAGLFAAMSGGVGDPDAMAVSRSTTKERTGGEGQAGGRDDEGGQQAQQQAQQAEQQQRQEAGDLLANMSLDK